MNNGGRTLIDWLVPGTNEQLAPSISKPLSRAADPRPERASLPPLEQQVAAVRATALTMQRHQFAAGQPLSYTDDSAPNIVKGGFEIVGLPGPGTHETNYMISSADESSICRRI